VPTREVYRRVVVTALTPLLEDITGAWKGIYSLLLWYEHGLPHIIDADKLLSEPWRSRARAVESYVARELGIGPEHLPDVVDQLLRSGIFPLRPQRQNPLGIGFVEALFFLLQHFASKAYEFHPEREIGKAVFPGVVESPRSKPDIVVVRPGRGEVAVVSAKWSLRHDRLKDVKDEAAYFKTLRTNLKFYIVTNEFDPARLDKLCSDYRVDGVFHVNKSAIKIAGLNGRTDALGDLVELLTLYQTDK
jgi:hypothetical protein